MKQDKIKRVLEQLEESVIKEDAIQDSDLHPWVASGLRDLIGELTFFAEHPEQLSIKRQSLLSSLRDFASTVKDYVPGKGSVYSKQGLKGK